MGAVGVGAMLSTRSEAWFADRAATFEDERTYHCDACGLTIDRDHNALDLQTWWSAGWRVRALGRVSQEAGLRTGRSR